MAQVQTKEPLHAKEGEPEGGDEDNKEFEAELKQALAERESEVVEVGESTPQTVSEEEIVKKLVEMRDAVEAAGVSIQHVDAATLKRFLKARNLKVDLSTKMYVNHVKWRKQMVPKGYVDESEIKTELAAEKVFLQVKEGQRSLMVVIARQHNVKERDLEETKRLAVYCIDKTVASLPPADEKFCVILDLQKAKMKNLDAKLMISVFDFLQAQYPERLGRLFMIHVPYIFWGVWKMVSPFIDKVTKEKILFVEDKNLTNMLHNEISVDMLPPEYGGSGKLALVQDVPIKVTPY